MLAQNVALLVIVILLLSHQNFQPYPVLGVHCGQRRVKARDTTLCLLNIVFEQVTINNKIYCFWMLLAVGDKDAEPISECVVNGADRSRDRV